MNDLKIKKTKQYNLFKVMNGNRTVNQNHVDGLIKSMKAKYHISPIQVNEKMEVVDGQHRLEAVKRLGLDLYYIVVQGATIDTVQTLNAHSRNWNIVDFIDCYANQGKKDYIIFREFYQQYDYTPTVAMYICGLDGGGRSQKHISAGNLRLPDINKAYDFANTLKKIRVFYKGYKRRSFILALRRCMNKKGFSMDEFLEKLSFQSLKMVDSVSVEQYIELIEEIYNYMRREKVNLRID